MDKELLNGIPEEEISEADVAEETTEEEIQAETENTEEESVEEAEKTVSEAEEETEEEIVSGGEEELTEDSLCILCGENRKNDDSDYCADCESAMYKSKIPFLGWISGIAVVCVSLLAFIITLLASAPALQAARGDVYASKNCWYAAYLEYSQVSSVVEEINSILGTESTFVKEGRGIVEKAIDSYAKSRSPLDAAYMAMMIYGENVAEEIPSLKEYVDTYEEFYNSYAIMSEPLDAMLTGATQEETFKALCALEGTEGLNDVYFNYFLFNAADYYKFSVDEKLEYVKAADECAKAQGRDFSWLYCIEAADILVQEGRYDEAVAYAEILAEKDKTNYRAHDLILRCLLAKNDADGASKLLAEFKTNNEGFDTASALEATYYRGIGDMEKSRLAVEEGLVENDFSAELHRQLALIYLAEGKYSEAFEEAFTADSNAAYMANYYMDSSGFTPQLDNTVYLCSHICKNKGLTSSENAVYLDQIIDYYKDFTPSNQVSAVLNGEKTVQQVLTEGVCDLA